MERAETGQDAAAEPCRVAALGVVAWRVDADPLARCSDTEFVAQAVQKARKKRATTHTHNVAKHAGARIDVDFLRRLEDEVREAHVRCVARRQHLRLVRVQTRC